MISENDRSHRHYLQSTKKLLLNKPGHIELSLIFNHTDLGADILAHIEYSRGKEIYSWATEMCTKRKLISHYQANSTLLYGWLLIGSSQITT